MKIGPHSDPHIALTGGVKPAGASSAVAGASGVAGDRSQGVAVSVSHDAKALSSSQGNGFSDVDTAKVDAFRAAIAQGTFVVNAGAIADKLLSNAQEMLNRTRI